MNSDLTESLLLEQPPQLKPQQRLSAADIVEAPAAHFKSINNGSPTKSHSNNHLSPSIPSSSSSSSLSSQLPVRKPSVGSFVPFSSSSMFKGFQIKKTPLSLQFNNLSLTLPNGQLILDDVTGHFPHSRLVAIMGPSGAGKTSFLNVLAGRSSYGKMSGTIKMNHIPTNINDIKSICGYVPQDDILHSDLTVYENLYYSAMLRLPKEMEIEKKLQIIEDVILMLGLDHVKKSLVGSVEKRGISGGQRKRVNIGCELVSNPSLLFMDEPTSGLDASAALEILSSLNKLAELGLTIITVIHQPRYSIFSSFHTVLFLGQGGRTVFLGPTNNVINYFDTLGFTLPQHENPADFVCDVISGVVRERKVIDEITQETKIIKVPALTRSESNPANNNNNNDGNNNFNNTNSSMITLPSSFDLLPQLSMSQTLTRTLSQSQSLMNVASLIIDISELGADHADDDRHEPIIDFNYAWLEYQQKQEQLKRIRKESRASPEQRTRSLSDASNNSSLSNNSNLNSINNNNNDNKDVLKPSFTSRIYALLSRNERARQQRMKMELFYNEFAEHFIDEENEFNDENKSNNDPNTQLAKGLNNNSEDYVDYSDDSNDNNNNGCLSFLRSKKLKSSTINNINNDDKIFSSSLSPKSASSFNNYSPNSSYPRSHRHHDLVFGLPTIESSPSILTQYLLLSRRLGLKLFRNWTFAIIDIFLVIFLSVVVGWVYGDNWTLGEYTTQSVFSSLCMGVCATVASLRIFGSDRLVYWRESLVGVSETAYFLSLMTIELHRAFVYPAIFCACYSPLAKPQAAYTTIYGVFVATYFAMSGLGLLLSVIVRPVPALMIGTMLPLVIGGFLSGVNPPVKNMSSMMAFASNFSFTRWAVEPLGMAEAKFVTIYGADNVFYWQDHFGFLDHYWVDLGVLALMGVVFRLLTGLALRRFSRTFKG